MQFSDLTKLDQIVNAIITKLTDQDFINTILNDLSIADGPSLKDDFDLEEYITDDQLTKLIASQ